MNTSIIKDGSFYKVYNNSVLCGIIISDILTNDYSFLPYPIMKDDKKVYQLSCKELFGLTVEVDRIIQKELKAR